ncbi:unnamed protein product [Rhizopus stolonifer]
MNCLALHESCIFFLFRKMNKKVPSLDSFYQLLKGQVFYNTDYQSSLIECMRQATLPIHPKFSLIINEFAISTFTVDKIQKIPEEILDEFRDYSKITATQVLLLFYVLTHNDCSLAVEPSLSLFHLLLMQS